MMHSLAKWQHEFSQALQYQHDGASCAIVSDQFSSQQRLQIYRNNYILSLSEVLAATYPLVLALVGEACFAQLARQHILTTPNPAGDVTSYGENFHHSIEHFPAVIDAAVYLPQVALFEWQHDLSRQAFATQSIESSVRPLADIAHLSAEQQGDIQLCLTPSLRLFQCDYAIFSLQKAINNETLDQFNIHQSQQGIIHTFVDGHSQAIPLSKDEYQLAKLCQQKCTLANIEPSLLNHLDSLINAQIIIGFRLAN
ncbi:hypothetical protein BCU68_07520 [Vibrio sp. 10N.286.49.B3]|uniref:HvfC/BufC N-terminal domain-containing protein n=1 Tax=Vibrio sp. 10N.286.49.B3 TaxID=1880855 RepID=UPI000C83417A|nr:DNA-binding domain-containing protein [Vibrio sp. 10N.286.49.B3]PMH38673.1 hypothetical protein BCU68_07520 [Vibrio sp. 10N.286.49.B3]